MAARGLVLVWMGWSENCHVVRTDFGIIFRLNWEESFDVRELNIWVDCEGVLNKIIIL